MKKLFLLPLFSLLALFGARAEIANVDDTGDGIANEAVTINGITYDVTLHGVGGTEDGSAQITGVRAADGNEQSLIGLEELVLPETITYNEQTFRVYHLSLSGIDGTDIKSLVIPRYVSVIDDFVPAAKKFTFMGSVPEFTGSNFIAQMQKWGVAVFVREGLLGAWSEWAYSHYINVHAIYHTIDGIHYVLRNLDLLEDMPDLPASDLTASVTSTFDYSMGYVGDIAIPERVTYGGHEFTVTEIGDEAFNSQFEVTSVTLPATIERLGGMAFYKDISLSSLTCLATVPPATSTNMESIDYSICESVPLFVPAGSVAAYKAADMWKEFRLILPIGTKLAQIDGFWYALYPEGTAMVIADRTGMGYEGDLVVPASVTYEENDYAVTAVGDGAFFEMQFDITSVSLPASIQSIGRHAFSIINTETEHTLTVHATVPPATLDTDEDRYLTFMEQYTIYGKLRVPYSALDTYRQTLPWSLFSNIEAIPETMPKYVNEGYVQYMLDTTTGEAQAVALTEDCPSGADITIASIVYDWESDVTSYPVTAIKDFAFSRTALMKSITIPAEVTAIGANAFLIEENLESIRCLSATPHAALTGVASPVAAEGTFSQWCFDNVTLIVPFDALDTYKATAPWSSFKNIKGVHEKLYITVDNIEYELDQDEHTAAVIGGNRDVVPEDAAANIRETVQDEAGNSYTVTSMSDYAFDGWDGVQTVDIPASMQRIGLYAIAEMPALVQITCHAVTPPDVLDCVTAQGSFDQNVLQNAQLYVPAGSLDAYKNHHTWGLFANIFEIDETKYVTADGIVYRLDEGDEGALIAVADHVETPAEEMAVLPAVTDPETDREHTVTMLSDWLFSQHTGIKAITISATIEQIGNGAFYALYALETLTSLAPEPPACVIASAEDGVMGSFDEALYESVMLRVPSASIDAYKTTAPWSNFKNISPIVVEVEGVDYQLDSDAGTAAVVANPENNYQGEVVIEPTVTDAEGNEYPVTSISDNAFADQTGITSVVLPETIEELGSGVFDGCTELTSIECQSTTPPTAISGSAALPALHKASRAQMGGTFSQWCYDNVTLIVPDAGYDAYKSTAPWSNFANIVKKTSTGISAAPLTVSTERIEVYDLNGRIVYRGAANHQPALTSGAYVVKRDAKTAKVMVP